MPKFFVPDTISQEETRIEILGEDGRHLRDVLRIKTGEGLTVCDASGMDHRCVVDTVDKEGVTVRILSRDRSENESPFEIVLYQGLPKADKMENIIQKSVELGVSRIIPVACARSVVKLSEPKDIDKKLLRWNKIAYESAKQCARGVVPQVGQPVSFKDALAQIKSSDVVFIPWELEERTTLKTILQQAGNPLLRQAETSGKREGRPLLSFMVGPEGGFDQEEIMAVKQDGIATVTLGKRILRTETAAPAILAMILYETEQ